MHRRGYSNRAAARSAVRNATVRRSLARGRVAGNVVGVERRGGGMAEPKNRKCKQKCRDEKSFVVVWVIVSCGIISAEKRTRQAAGGGHPVLRVWYGTLRIFYGQYGQGAGGKVCVLCCSGGSGGDFLMHSFCHSWFSFPALPQPWRKCGQ